MSVVVADIGGTKSWLAMIDEASGRLLHESRLLNRDFDSFYQLLASFTDSAKQAAHELYLALPAPVNGSEVKLTNLDWTISAAKLKSRYDITRVTFINDFQAAALGTTTVSTDQLAVLNDQPVEPNGVRVVTGAGTGLGVAYMHWQHGRYHPFATEAGHSSFAPIDQQQFELRQYLSAKYDHVSYERIVSGPGIADLYQYLSGTHTPSPPHDAQWVNEQAAAGNETARKAMALFARVFGAFAGNLALAFKPLGGLYVTGGVSAKTASWLQSDDFIEAFSHKGRMSGLVKSIPVYLVKNERVGLQGAIQLATMNLEKEPMP